MGLDRISLEMLRGRVSGAAVLCLGYPAHPDGRDTLAWLKQEGATEIEVVDVIAHTGFERIVDLNEPVTWNPRFGLIINPGTLEHCFNIGVAWSNVWSALAVSGVILHVAPATMLDHGFWNVCRVALSDWCAANGGTVLSMKFGKNGTAEEIFPTGIGEGRSGRSKLPPETVVYALCQKDRDVPRVWPAQGVYRR
jgi:hypothetical protein